MAARKKVVTVAATTRSKRVVVSASKGPASSYFASANDKDLEFVSTGCEVLNAVLGGGWVLGRVSNIVGDKSSGKTLLAIEACANFARDYPEGQIRYAEAEAAFDEKYAGALGMPLEAVEFAEDIATIEDFFEDMEKYVDSLNGRPGLYVLDSLDAISDRAELARKIDEGSFGTQKPKLLGQLFRRLVKKIEGARILLIVISQIRDKIGVTFGETKTRSGGRALDFYASQILWLSEIGKMKRTIDKVDRIVGVNVKAKCKKNKIGLPFRECDFPILFGYGVDDLTANVEWLISVNRTDRLLDVGLSAAGYKVRLNNLRGKGGEEVRALRSQLQLLIRECWKNIETSFLPTASKY